MSTSFSHRTQTTFEDASSQIALSVIQSRHLFFKMVLELMDSVKGLTPADISTFKPLQLIDGGKELARPPSFKQVELLLSELEYEAEDFFYDEEDEYEHAVAFLRKISDYYLKYPVASEGMNYYEFGDRSEPSEEDGDCTEEEDWELV